MQVILSAFNLHGQYSFQKVINQWQLKRLANSPAHLIGQHPTSTQTEREREKCTLGISQVYFKLMLMCTGKCVRGNENIFYEISLLHSSETQSARSSLSIPF